MQSCREGRFTLAVQRLHPSDRTKARLNQKNPFRKHHIIYREAEMITLGGNEQYRCFLPGRLNAILKNYESSDHDQHDFVLDLRDAAGWRLLAIYEKCLSAALVRRFAGLAALPIPFWDFGRELHLATRQPQSDAIPHGAHLGCCYRVECECSQGRKGWNVAKMTRRGQEVEHTKCDRRIASAAVTSQMTWPCWEKVGRFKPLARHAWPRSMCRHRQGLVRRVKKDEWLPHCCAVSLHLGLAALSPQVPFLSYTLTWARISTFSFLSFRHIPRICPESFVPWVL